MRPAGAALACRLRDVAGEAEAQMEQALHAIWGRGGLGSVPPRWLERYADRCEQLALCLRDLARGSGGKG